ncbi:MAG: hypothetical protein ABIZ34_00140 [Candidatus Limnocylindrales bacterium]
MDAALLRSFPGHEIVEPGIADLVAGVDSQAALAVALAADRLRAAGVVVPALPPGRPAHQLYLRLAEEHGDDAHSRYRALVLRVVSFARAAEHATAR